MEKREHHHGWVESQPPNRIMLLDHGRSTERELMQMRGIAEGLAKGERIGLGIKRAAFDRWLYKYHQLTGTVPTMQWLDDAEDLVILGPPIPGNDFIPPKP